MYTLLLAAAEYKQHQSEILHIFEIASIQSIKLFPSPLNSLTHFFFPCVKFTLVHTTPFNLPFAYPSHGALPGDIRLRLPSKGTVDELFIRRILKCLLAY